LVCIDVLEGGFKVSVPGEELAPQGEDPDTEAEGEAGSEEGNPED
jgi:hypothetical protein